MKRTNSLISVSMFIVLLIFLTGCQKPITKTDLEEMIKNGEDVTEIDTSAITDMSYLFEKNLSFSQDISGWDVSNVENMYGMFMESGFNQDISGWDVSNVTNMNAMFMSSPFNQDISDWDVSNVRNMYAMFFGALKFNQDISGWDVSRVEDMSGMFAGNPYYLSAFNQDISGWDVSNVTDMSGMFFHATSFKQDISGWDVSSVKNHDDFSSGRCPLTSAHHPDPRWND